METHKILINACFGGFSVSYKALQLYYQRKYNQKLYFYKSINWDGDYVRCKLEEAESAFTADLGEHYNKYEENHSDTYVSKYSFDRTDPVLIEIVEELGKEANGPYADLKVVTIKGNKYRINEYDGYESIETPYTIKWDIIKD